MRQVKAFLLTVLICVNLFGFYAMFLFKQAEIKTEMSERVSMLFGNQSEVLTFSKAEFNQLVFSDNNKELRLYDRLYDIVSIESNGSQVSVTVEYDSKETELVETFGNLLSGQQDKDQNSSPLKTIISHFQQDYITVYERVYAFDNLSVVKRCVVNNAYPSSSFVADNLTPPPQFFLV
jgi:hypothetical protein